MAYHKIQSLAVVVAILAAMAAVFTFSYSGIPDVDGFYHARHAALYASQDLFQTEFPWTQYSIIKKFAADIWYGFHILIIPFQNIKFGGFVIMLMASLLAFMAFGRLKVKWPLFWTLMFIFASADLLFRLTMFRPHPLSLGLSLLLFAFLSERGKSVSKDLIGIFFIGFFISWVHLALSWLPVLIALVIIGARLVKHEPLFLKESAALLAGLAAGWLARPNPLGAAQIAYIQIVQLFLAKGAPLRFGRELTPFTLENFVDQLLPIFTLVLLAAGALFGKLLKNSSAAMWSSLILAAGFFYLTFATARRSNEVFVSFAVIFIALIFTKYTIIYKKIPPALALILLATLIYMPLKNIYRFATYTENAFAFNRFKEVSVWLKGNSQPGEIVFNPHWDRFAQLFYWNQHNYYINGMDPIFEHAYDPALYWKTHFLATDLGSAFTCGKLRCTQEEVEPTPLVLKRDFRASYVIVEKRRNPKLFSYLESAPEFKKVFETQSEALYKIL